MAFSRSLSLSAPAASTPASAPPLDTDLSTTKLGPKRGTSTARSILGLVAWGDASSAAAAKEGNITVLNHMDQETMAVLFFLYVQYTTIVYGD